MAAARAVAEVVTATFLYIVLSYLAARSIDVSALFTPLLAPAESRVGGVFLVGVIAQLCLFLALAFLLQSRDARAAIAAHWKPATAAGWTIALIAAAIHAATATAFFIQAPEAVIEPSARNLLLSIVPAPDGWTQELMFRGYILFRLARAGVAPALQILLSGAAFGAMHWGYAGDTFWAAFWPIAGTTMLGCFLAASVRASNFSLKPAIVAHVGLIVLTQPWLALAR